MIEIRELRLSYGARTIFDNVSAVINKGDRIGLVGSNGAGKTTTLTTISGLRKPSGGSILFQGRPLHTIPSHEIVRLGITQSNKSTPRSTALSIFAGVPTPIK